MGCALKKVFDVYYLGAYVGKRISFSFSILGEKEAFFFPQSFCLDLCIICLSVLDSVIKKKKKEQKTFDSITI